MHSLKNNKSLIELILDGNNLTYKSCLFLTTLFKFNSTLLHLGLDQNNIGNHFGIYLVFKDTKELTHFEIVLLESLFKFWAQRNIIIRRKFLL